MLKENLPKLINHFKPGIDDVNIKAKDDKEIYIESKKGYFENKNG